VEHATKGGVGCAVVERDGFAAGAVMVVNAFGTVHDADGKPLVARTAPARATTPATFADAAGRNTTVGAVVVSAALSKLALAQLARAATAAFHRRIVPAGSPFDGDVLFALAPMGELPHGLDPDPATALMLESLAVAAIEQAIERAVRLARGRDGVPGLADDAASPSTFTPVR
jgi:L-aminopeptidase/D-esterase-like protein